MKFRRLWVICRQPFQESNSYYGGNKIINVILSPFGYRTCRHFGRTWCHLDQGNERCLCIIRKDHEINYQFETSVGRYCDGCAQSMAELSEEDARDEAQADLKAEWCEAHPEDEECKCEEDDDK